MQPKRRLFIHLIWIVILTSQACQGSAQVAQTLDEDEPLITSTSPAISTDASITTQPPPKPEEEETPVEEEESIELELGEETVLLWAVEATASSHAGDPQYHPDQALDQPNTHACGDFVTAWQPAPDKQDAWIELAYFPYILPESISITQSFYPAQITRIDVVTLDDELLNVFDAGQVEMGDVRDICPVSRNFSTPEVDVLIRAVRISLEREVDEPWTQVDAVSVTGWVAEEISPPEETQVWFEDEEIDFYQPRYFSNKNMVNALLFEGDRLWAASNGGVVAWDITELEMLDYVHAYTQATYALALCDWGYPLIVAGGDRGIATLTPPYDAYGPYFELVEHPGDGNLGRVVALACDNQRQQIWVGYTGFLSRYDAGTQTWEEYSWREGLPNDTVRDIAVIDGDVWVATANGVAVLREGDTLEVFTTENSNQPCQFVHGIASDEAGNLWMASSCGLIEFDQRNWTLWESEQLNGGLLTNMLMDIAQDQYGTLWLGDTFGTLCQFEPTARTCLGILMPPDDYFSLETLQVDGLERMAVGSLVHGLKLIVDEGWISLRTRDQLDSNRVQTIAYAPDGNLWLGAGTALQHFPVDQPSAPWITESLPVNATVHSLFVANDGLWVGYTGGARFIPHLAGEESFELPMEKSFGAPDNTVTAINRDANGLVYFGLSSGLYIWDGSAFRYEDLRSEADREKNYYPPRVNTIYAHGEEVWVGSRKGLFRFEKGSLTDSWISSLQSMSSFYSASVGVFAPSPRGEGFLVGVGSELFRFDGNQFELVLELPSEISSLYAGPYQLWLATASSGLYEVTLDDTPNIYWDMVWQLDSFPDRFGYQAITMSDSHTLWVASSDSGLVQKSAMYGQ